MPKWFLGCGIVGVIGAIIGAVVLILGIMAAFSYNRLVNLSTEVDKQWAQVQTVYQRRFDLIPNLVATVQGAANFEKSTLTEVTLARASVGKVTLDSNSAPTAAQMSAFQQSQSQLSGALSRLLVVAERYPELRATANFSDLQAQLEGTENRISVERERFNDAVKAYDTAIRSFPAVLYAGMMGFSPKAYFDADTEAQKAPRVNFSNDQPASPPPQAQPTTR